MNFPIDITSPTDSIIWEIEAALEFLSPKSILLTCTAESKYKNEIPDNVRNKLEKMINKNLLQQCQVFIYPPKVPRPGLGRFKFLYTESKLLREKLVKCILSGDEYQQHIENEREHAGERTRIFRRMLQAQEKRHFSRVMAIATISLGLLAFVVGIVIHQQITIKRMQAAAEAYFFAIKDVEIQIALLMTAEQSTLKSKLAILQEKRKKAEEEYNNFIRQNEVIKNIHNREDQLIRHVAHVFGECEINVPQQFIDSIKVYIKLWQSTTMFQDAIRRAEQNQYTPTIIKELNSYFLPRQFFYLALKESEFKVDKIGPRTTRGLIAKGMWQFIPETARAFGLRTGPLIHERVFDARDERHDFHKSTHAAAAYLNYLYSDESQGSGLLAAASYNWGPTKVNDFIRKMPNNPRERNYWALLRQYPVPDESRRYIFYIFAAAVIGEDPHYFKFNFDNPLHDSNP